MITKKVNNVEFVVFEEFLNQTRHAFSTRIGGISQDNFSSLNLKFGQDKNVLENYKIFAKATQINLENMVFANQVHDINIIRVTSQHRGMGIFLPTTLPYCDGLSTNQKGVCLVTQHADCVPLFFLDKANNAIALSHAGWKGTVKKIASETVQHMVQQYNSNPKNILVGIGPSIGPCCFETSLDCAEHFLELPQAKEFIVQHHQKYFIDLWSINKTLLMDAGIQQENIFIANECTKCHNEKYYSHRVLGNIRGGQVAVMELI